MRYGTMIAVHKSIYNDILGVRIKGTQQFSGKVVDITVQQLALVLSTNPDAIDNIKALASKPAGFTTTNGHISCYTKLIESNPFNISQKDSTLVILNRLTINGKKTNLFEFCDYSGNELVLSADELDVHQRAYKGIANGIIKTGENCNKYIIAKLGTMPTRELTDHEKEMAEFMRTYRNI